MTELPWLNLVEGFPGLHDHGSAQCPTPVDIGTQNTNHWW